MADGSSNSLFWNGIKSLGRGVGYVAKTMASSEGEDPLVNLVERGLNGGASYLGKKLEDRRRRLSENQTTNAPSGSEMEPPERVRSGSPESDKENWGWLKSILTNISTDISAIKTILSDYISEQQNEIERSNLAGIEAENESNRPQLFGKPEKEENEEKEIPSIKMQIVIASEFVIIIF